MTDDMLKQAFELQANLQRETYGAHPSDIPTTAEKIVFIKDMHIALTDELHEMLAETSWKPWQSAEYINTDAAKGELVDAFHFFMNLCMAVGMDADELFERYKAKRLKNIKRQVEGYDGVSTKCPGCKRALDDDAVDCEVEWVGVGEQSIYCVVKNEPFTVAR